MGFFSRLPVPRGMRRAGHAATAGGSAGGRRGGQRPLVPAAPRPLCRPPAAATIESAANGNAGVWRHGDCKVNHRSAEAAAKCRNR